VLLHSILGLKGVFMDNDLLIALEARVEKLVSGYADLKRENESLHEEKKRLLEERSNFKLRLDAILNKLEGI
jgi:FtsZ-binding cell division protein ZapB